MPKKLTAVMLKTSGDAEALRPHVETFAVSVSSSTTNYMLNEVADRFPASVGQGGDESRMISAPHAKTMLDAWCGEIKKKKFITSCPTATGYIQDMRDLAGKGYSMLLIED